MTITEYNNLRPGDSVSYDLFSNIKYLKEMKINGIDHVVIIDYLGHEKTVYKSLFLKYGNVEK